MADLKEMRLTTEVEPRFGISTRQADRFTQGAV